MPSFESTIQEIEAQLEDLPSYASYLNSISIEKTDPAEALFVGAGDSLACARYIERLMNFKPRSMDPYDLFKAPEISRGKVVHFISVSGRTKSNIEAASSVKGVARDTVAITANPESPLAKICSRILELKFSKASGLTPGTNSFTASLLACYRLFHKLPDVFNLGAFSRHAKDWGESHSENAETVHFLSSGELFPIAMYGAAKVFEFVGGKADYQLTEEFSHLNLFSMNEKDLVVILNDGTKDSTEVKLSEELNRGGFCAQLLSLDEGTSTQLEMAISGAIHMQYFALNMALRKGVNQPAFLENQKLLQLSNRMIYLG